MPDRIDQHFKTEGSARANHQATEQMRRALLANAEIIVRQNGRSALKVRGVTRASGCSVGTLYNLFGDIDGLVAALNGRTLDELAATLKDAQEHCA